MKKLLTATLALFLVVAFTFTSFAATAKKVATDNPENAKQAITQDDKAKIDKAKATKANVTKEKKDAKDATKGKKVEKKEEQQKK